MTRLQHVQRPPHVALAELDQAVHRLGLYPHMLLLDDLVDQRPDVRLLQRAEPEARTSRQQGRRQLVCVVGDDAEPGVGGVLLHDAAERHLRGRGHGVRFIEDDQLEGPEGGAGVC